PSKNVTVPVGVPLPGAVAFTVAVNVTACPTTAGFADDATVVVVDALPMVWLSAADVLPVKPVSPAYCAVIVCAATARELVASVAWRAAFSAPAPSDVAPSKNVTVPVGVALPEATAFTVAVNVTACPTTAGFADDATVVVVDVSPVPETGWERLPPLDVNVTLPENVADDAGLNRTVTAWVAPAARLNDAPETM